MFRCQRCGTDFEEPKQVVDSVEEYFGRRVNMMINVCPECGYDEFDRLHRCRLCHEWHDGDDDYCETCEEILMEHVNDVLNELAERFKFEKEVVREAIKEVC